MADDINEPQLEKPINEDLPDNEDIEEKNFFDNNSAPTIQNPNDNNQYQNQNQNPVNNPPPYYNPNNNNNIQPQYLNQNNIQPQYYNPNNIPPQYYPPGSPQPVSQAYPGQMPYYQPPENYNNGIQYNYEEQAVQPQYGSPPPNPKKIILLSIVLIAVFIIDIILEFIFCYNLLVLIDDAAILIIAIIFLIPALKGKIIKSIVLGIVNIIVWFGGFGLRVYGMTKFELPYMIIIEFFLTGGRTVALFMFIPLTCNQN